MNKIGNDSVLYTGSSSVSLNRNRRADKVAEKAQKRDKLLPAADIVMDAIDKKIESLRIPEHDKVQKYSYDGLPGTLEVYIASRDAAIEEMKSLKQNLQNLLRDNKESN